MDQKYQDYLILVTVTLAVAWLISFLLRRVMGYFIRRNTKQLLVDPTNFIFLKNSVTFICFSAAIIWVFTQVPYLQTLGNALFASAGIFAAILGFASQKAFANIVGGVFILIFKPFRVDDVIEISTTNRGIVEEITLRHTVIRDFENRRIVIPNSIISEETITNSSITDKRIRRSLEFGISYDADIQRAMEIIAQEIEKHPLFVDERTEAELSADVPAVPVQVVRLADFSVVLRAFAWTRDFESSRQLEWDVLHATKLSFDNNGIEIPFPYRTIVFKNAHTLSK